MSISKTKGLSPRYPVLTQVIKYEFTMGTVINSLVVKHKSHRESLITSLKHIEDCVYKSCKGSLMKTPPGKGDDLEKKLRYNDSVSRLRIVHNKTLDRIKRLGYSGEI